jgi:hypothetical protein
MLGVTTEELLLEETYKDPPKLWQAYALLFWQGIPNTKIGQHRESFDSASVDRRPRSGYFSLF